jgi:pentatricopeptide repeat protein
MDKNTALACLYAKMGQPERARQILRDIEKRDILPRNHALILVALGENERAIEVLEKGARKLKAYAAALWMEPGLDPLRSDPRIQRLIDSVAPPTR